VREHQITFGLREDLADLIGSILIDNVGLAVTLCLSEQREEWPVLESPFHVIRRKAVYSTTVPLRRRLREPTNPPQNPLEMVGGKVQILVSLGRRLPVNDFSLVRFPNFACTAIKAFNVCTFDIPNSWVIT
jgi:hypothetical protein